MQIRIAMQEPSQIPGQQIRTCFQLDISLDKWDIPLDISGYSVG
jgi:hypothetical protein